MFWLFIETRGCRFSKNCLRWNIAQLWKLFSYITIRIMKIPLSNCVSSLLSTHYSVFPFTAPLDFANAHGAFDQAQKSIWTPFPLFYRGEGGKLLWIKMLPFVNKSKSLSSDESYLYERFWVRQRLGSFLL